MGEKSQNTDHSIGFREICTILLAGTVFTLILWLLIPFFWASPSKHPIHSLLCIRDQQPFIYEMMRGVSSGESSELPPEWTVADLIREAVKLDRKAPHPPTPERCFRCRAAGQPYLVFPASASVVFDQSLPEPVPILMCPPGEHGKGAPWFRKPPKFASPPGEPWKYGTPVLYSDGSVKVLTTEDAEKLVKELSPVPFILDPEAQNEVKP